VEEVEGTQANCLADKEMQPSCHFGTQFGRLLSNQNDGKRRRERERESGKEERRTKTNKSCPFACFGHELAALFDARQRRPRHAQATQKLRAHRAGLQMGPKCGLAARPDQWSGRRRHK